MGLPNGSALRLPEVTGALSSGVGGIGAPKWLLRDLYGSANVFRAQNDGSGPIQVVGGNRYVLLKMGIHSSKSDILTIEFVKHMVFARR